MTTEEIETGLKYLNAATPGPVTASADTTNPDELVDRIYDRRGNVLAQVWPLTGVFEGFEKAQAEGRLYAFLRNNAPALLSATATLLKVREAMKGVDAEVNRIVAKECDKRGETGFAINLCHVAAVVAKVQALLEEREGAG